MKASAAHSGRAVLLIAATVCVQIMLGCGDERPPWSGFPIFPDAGGFELSPELASGLLAAQQAFAKQIAEQGAAGAGNASNGTTGPIMSGRATAGAAAPTPPPNDRDQAEGMPANPAAPKPDDRRRSRTPREDTPSDAGTAAERDTPQTAADSGEPTPPADAGAAPGSNTPQTAADSGEPTPPNDSGTQPAPDASPPAPTAGNALDAGPTPTLDAGTAPPTAGSAASETAQDAGTATSDADGGN